MDPVSFVPENDYNCRFTKINFKSRAKAKFPFLSTSLCGPLCGDQWFDGVGQAEGSPGVQWQWQRYTSTGNKTLKVVKISFVFHVPFFFL